MKVDAEDFRRVYERMNDDALLGVKRDELVEVAQQCYDVEVARRGLTAMKEVPKLKPQYEPAITKDTVDPDVTIATFTFPDEAKLSRALLESANIPCYIRDEQTLAMNWNLTNALGGLRLTVPASYAEQAREVLDTQISDEELAEQAEAAGELELNKDETAEE